MRKYTLEQYKEMAERFNKMSFRDKIITIRDNSDILTLASDYNCWAVKVKDKEIQEELYDKDWLFTITQEWGYREMSELIDLLGIGNTDL